MTQLKNENIALHKELMSEKKKVEKLSTDRQFDIAKVLEDREMMFSQEIEKNKININKLIDDNINDKKHIDELSHDSLNKDKYIRKL